jgi:hypothetical protein
MFPQRRLISSSSSSSSLHLLLHFLSYSGHYSLGITHHHLLLLLLLFATAPPHQRPSLGLQASKQVLVLRAPSEEEVVQGQNNGPKNTTKFQSSQQRSSSPHPLPTPGNIFKNKNKTHSNERGS